VSDDRTAIANLIYRYGELVDAGDFAGVGRLLADARVRDATGQLDLTGAEAIERLYVRTTRRYPDTGTPKTKHLITNLIVEIDEASASATCRSHYTVLQRTEALPLQTIIAGHYRHRLERRGSAWRIVEHVFHVDLVGDLGHHLLVDLDAARRGGA
jgi:3-phenylpropionate/cinnamic acid dioxygenase small subunit